LKRPKVLKKKRSTANNTRKHRFITAYEPAFPDIRIILQKHQHIIKSDPNLLRIFPRGARDFQVAFRKDSRNIKEILALSSTKAEGPLPKAEEAAHAADAAHVQHYD
jgi:hypothetical protein